MPAPESPPTTDDVRAATDALLAEVGGLTDEELRAPSLLPGWSRGHLLTHLARSADAMGNLARWARTGVRTAAYASPEARTADIEAGSGRPLRDLLEDLSTADDRLLATLDELPDSAAETVIRLGSREIRAGLLPHLRLREIVVHHVDLGLGFGTRDWSPWFVTVMLTDVAGVLRDNGTAVSELVATDLGRRWPVGRGPALSGTGRDLFAWVTGRACADPLIVTPAGPVPAGPVWV